MPTMADIREKFPQYNDLSDDDLAKAVHKKSYSDMPFDQFLAKIGKHGGSGGTWAAPNEGLSYFDKVGLAMHDTDDERELYLQKRFGEGNVKRQWGDGKNADFLVTHEGKTLYVKPNELGFFAETGANAPEPVSYTHLTLPTIYSV